MNPSATVPDARPSLADHVVARGTELFQRHGPPLGRAGLERVLADRTLVRYPCEIVFGSDRLEPGELAFPEPRGPRPEDGFTMHVHPAFADDPDEVAAIVLYQLVAVNYGAFASAEEAEAFGAAALGQSQDEYYERLCGLADRLAAPAATSPARPDPPSP